MRTSVIGLTGGCGPKNARIPMLVVAAALAGAACEQADVTSPSRPHTTGEMPAEAFAGSQPVASDLADVVATVELVHGGAVTFLDLGDGHIGIGERTPGRAQPVSRSMIENLNATPLEVFLALRPRHTGVPVRLLRDHQMRAAQSRQHTATPRVLTAPRPTGSELTDPGYGSYGCHDDGSAVGFWFEEWIDAFAGITKYRSSDFLWDELGPYTFYPGAPVYFGTNTNSKTYLGACNGDGQDDDLVMEVHRRISGSWVKVHQVTIDGHERYTFYSGFPASYRGRTYPVEGDVVESYGIGAAWTLSPPIRTP